MNRLDFGTAFEQLTPLLADALWIVVTLVIFSFALALVVGMLIALGRLSSMKWLNAVLVVFLEIVRGTPLLVQLLYMYYVLPEIISMVGSIWFPGFHLNFSAYTASILGLGINYGCYLSEVFRSSIQSIDKGQMEAAQALGYTNRQAMCTSSFPNPFRFRFRQSATTSPR